MEPVACQGGRSSRSTLGSSVNPSSTPGLSMDLSSGGLFVATYQIKPVGSPVAVSLVLPDGHALWAKGVVRWVRQPEGEDTVPGMGVEFTDIEPQDLEAIKRFCELRAPMYYDSDD